MKAKHSLAFPVLGDPGNAYAKELSLTFVYPDDLLEIYRGFGIHRPEFNGDESHTLPMPARIVVDGEGVIRHIEADPDYTRRPEPEDTIEVLRTLV